MTMLINSLFMKDEASGKLLITTDAPMFVERRSRSVADFDKQFHEGTLGHVTTYGMCV